MLRNLNIWDETILVPSWKQSFRRIMIVRKRLGLLIPKPILGGPLKVIRGDLTLPCGLHVRWDLLVEASSGHGADRLNFISIETFDGLMVWGSSFEGLDSISHVLKAASGTEGPRPSFVTGRLWRVDVESLVLES